MKFEASHLLRGKIVMPQLHGIWVGGEEDPFVKENRNWKVAKQSNTAKTSFVQNLLQERDLNIELAQFQIQQGQVGIRSQGAGWGDQWMDNG